ncbi:MAG: transglutaminase-like domain-containing protein [archaeon]
MFSAKTKAVEEQGLWKKIEDLEDSLKKAESALKPEIEVELAKLKAKLHEIQSPAPKKRNLDVELELEKKQSQYNDLFEKYSKLRQAVGSVSEIDEKQLEKELKFRLYSFLLEKYGEIINEKEKKTIGEIKGLIDPDDLSIQSILAELISKNYSFEKNYLSIAREAYDFVVKEISFVESDVRINFWLTPMEIIKQKIADDEDMAVFLCTLLYALGDEKAFVVISEMENLSTHAFVITEHKNNFYLFDPSQKKDFEEFSGKKETVIEKYSFRNSKIKKFLYRFNATEYEQFAEEENKE